jgi:N6-adenosine-specific RNA methylase IME4
MDFPTGKYTVIYADPPWSYNDKLSGHSFGLPYVTQDIDWIKKLPVASIAAKDCACFMWAVSPQLPEAIATLDAWGFVYTTVAFVWNKQTSNHKDVKNLGRWTMGNVEVCLLGKRGHPQRVVKNVHQLVTDLRGRHSEKPHEVRKRIVTLMGDVPRIELFARQRWAGWDAWGNEVNVATACEDDTPLWD